MQAAPCLSHCSLQRDSLFNAGCPLLHCPVPPRPDTPLQVIPLRQLEPATVLAVHAFLQQLMRHREGQVTYHAVRPRIQGICSAWHSAAAAGNK